MRDKTIGLVLENIVYASMKDAEYNISAAFTKKYLIACQCECHVGGHNNKRFFLYVCPPLIYQLTLLLDNRFAKHFLTDLCSLKMKP